jgi:hypothetical protein
MLLDNALGFLVKSLVWVLWGYFSRERFLAAVGCTRLYLGCTKAVCGVRAGWAEGVKRFQVQGFKFQLPEPHRTEYAAPMGLDGHLGTITTNMPLLWSFEPPSALSKCQRIFHATDILP